MSHPTMHFYYRFVGILAALGILLALFSVMTVVYVAPLSYSVFKLSAMGVIDLVIVALAMNRRFAALVFAFLLNLYDLIYLHQLGVIYDAFHLNASVLSYCHLALAAFTLVVSGLGLLLYFKHYKPKA